MVSREELYELVWAEPMTRLAKRYEVSDSYLARICTLLAVPRPGTGYWAKVAVGKAPAKPSLPESLPGDPLHWSKEDEPIRLPAPQAPSTALRPKRLMKLRAGSIHALLSGAKTHFLNSRQVESGAYLKPFKRLLVDINSSAATLDKAFELANELFNDLAAAGHRVVIAPTEARFGRPRIDEREAADKPRNCWEHSGLWSPARPTVVYLGTVAIGLAFVEMSENVTMRYVNGTYVRDSQYAPARRPSHADHTWTTRKDIPSGRIRILAFSPYGRVDWSRQWQETERSDLRSATGKIVKTIEAAAPEIVLMLEEADRQGEMRRQQWLIEQDRREREEDGRRIAQSIIDATTELRQVIDSWSGATSIEQFLHGVEARAGQLEGFAQQAVRERLALAREFLGSCDPLEFFQNWKTPLERYTPKFP